MGEWQGEQTDGAERGWNAPERAKFENPWRAALMQACLSGRGSAVLAWLDAAPAGVDAASAFVDGEELGEGMGEAVGRMPIQLLCASSKSDWRAPEGAAQALLDAALGLLERGAKLAKEDGSGLGALGAMAGLCARGFDSGNGSRLKSLFKALRGHPEFGVEALWACQVARWGASGRVAPLAETLCEDAGIEALEWLVSEGLFDMGRPGPDGRLALGRARTAAGCQRMLDLGGEASARDAHGATASELARLSDRGGGEVCALLAREMLAKSNSPSDLPGVEEALRTERLLASARMEPLSGFRKAAKAHGNPCVARHEATGASALMEAIDGCRMTSAAWLLGKGSSVMEADAKGVSAASRLMALQAVPASGPGPDAVLISVIDDVDWSAKSKRGWSLAAEAAALAAAREPDGWSEESRPRLGPLCAALAYLDSVGARVGAADLCDPMGRGPVEVLVAECRRLGGRMASDRSYDMPGRIEDTARKLERACPGQVDFVACEALAALARDGEAQPMAYRWRILEDLARPLADGSSPGLGRAAAMLAGNSVFAKKARGVAPGFFTAEVAAAMEAAELAVSVPESKGLKGAGRSL